MATATAKKLDALDALAQGDPKKVIALMLWKARHREPDMYVRIDEKDLEGFEASVTFQKIVPDVLIKRPQGLPAQAMVPATHKRSAIPPRPAAPPKPFVIVTLVEKGTENVIRSIENNEVDYDKSRDQAEIRKARDRAPMLANLILKQAQGGETSLSDIQDAANALLILARAE